jgi:hypothetical protein
MLGCCFGDPSDCFGWVASHRAISWLTLAPADIISMCCRSKHEHHQHGDISDRMGDLWATRAREFGSGVGTRGTVVKTVSYCGNGALRAASPMELEPQSRSAWRGSGRMLEWCLQKSVRSRGWSSVVY